MSAELAQAPLEQKQTGFISQNERVGWWQLAHGATGPVDALVVGRELRDIYINNENQLRAMVQTYVMPTGNEGPISHIPQAKPNPLGYRMGEYEITNDFSLEYALKLNYSPTSKIVKTEESEIKTQKILPSNAPVLLIKSEPQTIAA